MKLKLSNIESDGQNVVIKLNAPVEVTDSRHARVLKGLFSLIHIDGFLESCQTQVEINSPFGMAYDYMNILSAADASSTISYMISEKLTKFPINDFHRFGDKNCVKDVSKAWFSSIGISLDVQADILTDFYKKEITTNDLIEHVMKYRPGQYAQPLENELNSVLSNFSAIYDVKLTPAYAKFLINIAQESTEEYQTLPF